jgi:glycine cleavage system H protein
MAEALKFTQDHLWIRVDGERAQIGVSDYGQGDLGEVIGVELPEVGDELEKGQPFGEIESVRTVLELVAPVTGAVTEINPEVEEQPTIINEDPYHEGWMVELKLSDEEEIDVLMDADEYESFVSGDSEG